MVVRPLLTALIAGALAGACTANPVPPPSKTSSSAGSQSKPSIPNVAKHLRSAPGRCGGPALTRQAIPYFGKMVGHDPVWGGFYVLLDSNGRTFHVPADVPRTGYGWRIKVLWVVKPGWKGPITLTGTDRSTGQPIWFETSGTYQQGPGTSVVLDPTHPPVPFQVGRGTNFPSYLFFPRASCYVLAASWSGGGWTVGFGFGR